ncbi:MAG TPA: class I SAM-dependent methyltransferase [Spirochaetia bacterium]|nr:class I SAM-dependent methyltransferase [Spirochaetia bacterium]
MLEAEKTDPHFELIFGRHAEDYHELVSHEDWKGNLPGALVEAANFNGRTVVELGAGTGRLTLILARLGARVLAFDRSQHMLDQAAANAREGGLTNVTFGLADNRAVPLPDGTAEVVIEGWSFGHTVSLAEGAWRIAAEALLAESMRLLKPDGTLVIVETLGTGTRMPEPPGSVLPVFYGFLERQLGFASRWVRTDYRFSSLTEARRLVELFFGRMVEYELLEGGEVIVPECTGVWHRTR